MHEMGMCEDVLRAVEQRAQGRQVAAIGVRAGVLLRVVPDAFRQSFELAATGGLAADADVELTIVPATATCETCGEAFDADEPFPACPACASSEVVVDAGHELILEWLRYEDAGAPTEVDAS